MLENELQDVGAGWWIQDNFAVGGDDVGEALAHLDADLAGAVSTPRWILINYGANDVKTLPAENDAKAEWRTMLRAYHTKWPAATIGIMRVWLRGYDLECDDWNDWIDEIIAESEFADYCVAGPDERIFLENGDNGVTYTSDGTHPNAAGYALTAIQWQSVMGY